MAARRRYSPRGSAASRTSRAARRRAHSNRLRPGRYRPRPGQKSIVQVDTSQLDRWGQMLSVSNRELSKQVRKRTRGAARKVVNAVKDEAPEDEGVLKKRGVRLSVTRKGVFIRIVGPKGAKSRPSNIGYLVTRGHRKRGGGRTRPDNFLDRGLNKSRPYFEADMGRAVDDTVKWMQRETAKIRRRRSRRRGVSAGSVRVRR